MFKGKTNLFITKGFKFNVADYLITNFHAPKSSLLSIVQAIYGDTWKELYTFALENNMKFLSFGDAVMFKIKTMAYKLISNDKNARAGLLSINNIEVQTPTFMPVATRGAIKSTPHQYLDKTSILLANAYHLHLRPGAQLINDLGGLHKFMNWEKLILTDSGGFQAWSLPTKLLNDGIEFKNVYDGSFLK